MEIPEKVFSEGLPFFLFSALEIEKSVQAARHFWRNWSAPGFEIYFSVKVNPNPYLLKIMSAFVDGFDVSSLSEAHLVRGLRSSGETSHITWSGPAKTDRALDEVLGWNLRCFHLDSFNEWEQILKRKAKVPCSLRLATTEIHNQKLGFSNAELARISGQSGQAWKAVHSYLGRETFSRESMQAFFQRLDAKIQAGVFVAQPEIFLGAGLPSHLILEKHLHDLKPEKTPQHILHLESGRGLIQSAGCYGTQILSLKPNAGKQNIIVDGGLQHLASHFLSPRYKAEQVEVRFFRQGQELMDRSDLAALHGSLSLWHDTMIDNIKVPKDLRRGDWILANHVGAYGYSTASNQFLGPSKIKEWLLDASHQCIDISPRNLLSYHEADR